MAGLAMGAGLAKRLFPNFSVANYIQIQLIIAAIALAFPFLILGLTQLNLSPWANLIALGSLTFLISFATGIEFSLAAQNQSSQPHTLAAKNYSMDLFGSAFGALLAGVVMLPLLGMVATCVILALLNVVSASVLGIFGKRNYSQP
jgi:predicted membrane-bound spermidine synthase